MKKILISTLFLLPLCACVDTERPLIEKSQPKIINNEKKEQKKDIVHPIVRKKLGIIEEEKVPEYVENIAKTTIVPISDFDQIAMTMTGQYVPEEFENDRIYYGYMKFFDREWARLQGFPDSYKLELSDTHLYKQFGNSVTVNVIEAIARQIKDVLE